jgi:integrase
MILAGMAMHHKLTKLQVTNAKPGRYCDGGGLWLQVGAGGTGSWLLRYQRHGKAHWMGLGSTNLIGLAEARERARLERVRLLDGVDPLQARRERLAEQRRAEASAITFREAAKAVMEARESEWSAEHARQWRASIAEVASTLGSLPVAVIDTALVLKAVEPIWRRAQTTGDRTRQRIEVVLDWATARGAREGLNPARWKGHLEHLLKDTHKVVHHQAMPYMAVGAFLDELRERPGVTARALEFLILCASRSAEVLGARWEEIDIGAKTWTIPAARMKADKPHVVPLSPAALRILAGQPHKGQYVFPAPSAGKAMERHALADLMKKVMGRTETTHGFRSTFTDWAADNTAYPQEVREQCLAHAIPSKVEAAYRRGALLEKRRRLMAEWANFCAKPMPASATVTSIGRAV